MQQYFLAIDIGASSGRHILGSVQNGKIVLEEVYRFKNGLVKTNGHLCWDLKSIFTNIVAGIKKCGELGKIPTTMGIDTWGVDFVLLDEKDEVLGDTVSYRDGRTKGMDAEVAKFLSAEELYARTGIQKVVFNSIYQMMAIKKEHPEYLAQAKRFLMIPEYFNFLLTGNQVNEYTNGTTTQLINAPAKDWDYDLIEKLGYPKEIFGPLCLPKTSVGHFTPAIREEVGFDCEVILPATHDTGSAVLAVPAQGDDFIFLSSGTWSLMGVEILEPNCTEKSRIANFTNEGGYDYRFRYLKNIMGLWMIQSVKAEYENKYSFDDLCNAAMEAKDFHSLVDVNDDCFLAPENMIQAVKDYCARTNQPVPETPGEIAACIYNSLVKSYAETVAELEKMTGRNYAKIHIVGGGCKDGYLNELTAKATGKTVIPGPSEATALGNILSQMLKAGIYANLSEARAASAATLLYRDTMEQNIITLSPGKGNATPMVVEALSRMDPEKENLLRFEKGTYHFFREGTLRKEYYMSNNRGGEKKIVFPILEQKHLTIDGGGSTFLFHGRIFPFLLDKSEDITLKNFIVDFDVARHAQGELVAQTKEYYDLKFDRTMNPFTVENGNITFRIGEEEERSSRDSLSLLHEFDMDAHQWDVSVLGSVYLQVGETTADLRNLATGLWKTHATQLSEDTVRFTFDSPRDTLPFHQVGHYVTMNIENRDNAIFFLNQSKDVTLQNCEIVRGAGMGVIAQLSENITADGLSIHVKEGRKDVVSITADAFHCVNCSGKVTVKNSFFADTMDDACNIHGIYTRIQKVEGNRVTASLSHQDQAGFHPYFPGDQVEIIDGESLCIKGRVTVLDSQLAEGDKMTLCLTIGAPEGFHICPGDLIESPDRMPEVLYENNVLRNCPRILLSSCKKMVVRGNDIYNKVHGVKITDCPGYWYESGRVKDVLIEDNIFRNCGYCWECGVIVINQQPGRSIVHENIRILRNRFEDTVSNFFDVSYVNGLTVEDNFFEIRPDWEKTAPQIPYKISHCTNVEIKNNVMKFL